MASIFRGPVHVDEAWVDARGDWTPLPNPLLGRLRGTPAGHVYHHSKGAYGEGYALCLHCGRAEPMSHDGVLPKAFTEPHRRLRGGRDEGAHCSGSSLDWALVKGISLGHDAYTDVLELQLRDPGGLWLTDISIASTLAVAIRDSIAEILGVQATELDCTTKAAKSATDDVCRSIVIYDRFAAGYASSAATHIVEILRRARRKLDCVAMCDSACPSCVLDFDRRFQAATLDRHKARQWLSEEWLQQLQLPPELRYLGLDSVVEAASLREALFREGSRADATGVRLYVGGSGEMADLGVAPLRSIAVRIVAQERKVELVIDGKTLAELGADDRFLLASLADIPGVTVHSVAALPIAGAANVLAEVVHGDLSIAWAAADRGAITANAGWGKPKAPLVSGRCEPQSLAGLKTVAAASLRPEPMMGGDLEIEVLAQLDGPVKGFGERLWKKVMADHPSTQRLLTRETCRLKRVTYSDRYLFTPLTVALVKEILLGLQSVLPSASWVSPSIEIFTSDSREDLRRGPGQRVFSDWPDLVMRDRVLRSLLSYVGIDATINAKDRKQLQHGRLLEVTFESGESLSLRFDQGVGYWRVPTGGFVNYRATEFEFSRLGMDEQRLVAQQVQRLAALAVPIEGGAQPTQIFVKVRPVGQAS